MSNIGTKHLEEYNLAIDAFRDSLKGLDAAIEEAVLRCEKALLSCGEARLAHEGEMAELASSQSSMNCPEREAIKELYRLAVITYGDAADKIQLRPRIANKDEREEMERAHDACDAAFKALVEHERVHKCTQAKSTRGRANV